MKNMKLILQDRLSEELAPLRVTVARIDDLANKAGESKEPRSVEVYYDELFDISQALHTSIRHIQEVFNGKGGI